MAGTRPSGARWRPKSILPLVDVDDLCAHGQGRGWSIDLQPWEEGSVGKDGPARSDWIIEESVPFCALLRTHRGAANLTQEELAARAGLSTDAISMLERGGRRAPRSTTVECLAGALKLDPAQRRAFVAAAMERSELADNGEKADGDTVQPRPSQTQKRSAVAAFGRRSWVGLVAVAVAVATLVGFVA